ncbi:hypothetical protein BLS_002490 [Venturia inaequalis]|uniref:DUF6594 domain-containing protein n=1 Tax=Venturia inaequalis TaxID=5025 RepID=A0A8H3UUC1_VENIN|nr:hypothetical protein BLS_002490 [Venturia inaequalis]KAE9976487.1 hypothetical protein EG328_002603 [Venturia inaequalis]KAE9989279.1 hypothetical protein EG327_002897 [Venturia inaequalis]
MSTQEAHYLNGYPELASFIATDRDRTTLIFKRFDRLAARNLLHLQSELARLQAKLDKLDQPSQGMDEDVEQMLAAGRCLRNWDTFKLATKNSVYEQERLDLYKEIKVTLKEYREALLFESTMASLSSPTGKILSPFLRKFNNKKSEATEGFEMLGGTSRDLYKDRDDLVTLRIPECSDRLTSFVQDHMGFLFETGVRDGQIGYASDVKIAQFVSVVSIFLAAMLLIGAIIGLYVVQSPKKRLGMLATFTTMFAVGVGLLTNARKPELFAATAA